MDLPQKYKKIRAKDKMKQSHVTSKDISISNVRKNIAVAAAEHSEGLYKEAAELPSINIFRS